MSSLVLSGDTSGSITLSAPAVAGTTTITLPTVSGGNFVVSDSSGNVGIGTTSPTQKLMVNGNILVADSFQMISSGTGGTASAPTYTWGGQAAKTGMYLPADNTIAWSTTTAERMRIDSSGNVLVGKTSTALTSNGWTFTPNTGSNYCFDMAGLTNECFNYNNTGTGTYDIAFRYQATVKGYIRVNSTNTTYSTTSDYRLKENVQPMVGALDKVTQLKPVTYTWKIDGKDGQGFIAHELQAVVPDAVVGEKDAVDEEGNPKYQGIDTSFLVATLTAAIQEQTQIINDLKARIETLESK